MNSLSPPVFRFAPSPNGSLHLGHAYSALLNHRMAQDVAGTFLLRIEDIDQSRCTPELEEAMLEDLSWLGIEWAGVPRRQSEHFGDYQEALETLEEAGLVYPGFMTRGEIKRAIEERADWPRDPDGAPVYPGGEWDWSPEKREAFLKEYPQHTWRLDMRKAIEFAGSPLLWEETGAGPNGETGDVLAAPQDWGDVILGRADTPTSYHLSVVLDDALQGVTHIVRGRDLFFSTAVHRVLQNLLGLPVPVYHHHDLILDNDGRKLSKSFKDTSLRSLRQAGLKRADIIRMVGLADEA